MPDLGVSYRSTWLVKHKLMETMRLHEQSRQLSGRVEIDDSYLGGERVGGKPGRGSENKVPFVVAAQTTEDGQTVWVCLALRLFTNESMTEFAARSLVRPLTPASDGLPCFAAMAAQAGVHAAPRSQREVACTHQRALGKPGPRWTQQNCIALRQHRLEQVPSLPARWAA